MNSSVQNPVRNRTSSIESGINVSGINDSGINGNAKAAMVNRTRRVIRERAKVMQARRSKVRSLWIPLAVCSALTVIFCSAIWNVLDEYELAPTGVPDSRYQLFVLMLWFFPVSASLLGMVWFRRFRNRSEEGAI